MRKLVHHSSTPILHYSVALALARARLACSSAKCFSDQRQSPCNGSIKVRPSRVSEYSTFGGTTGWTLRCTSPSRSRLRKVWVNIFCEMPPMARCNSAYLIVPLARIWITSAVHLSAIRSSTSRDGHCGSRTEGGNFPMASCILSAAGAQQPK